VGHCWGLSHAWGGGLGGRGQNNERPFGIPLKTGRGAGLQLLHWTNKRVLLVGVTGLEKIGKNKAGSGARRGAVGCKYFKKEGGGQRKKDHVDPNQPERRKRRKFPARFPQKGTKRPGEGDRTPNQMINAGGGKGKCGEERRRGRFTMTLISVFSKSQPKLFGRQALQKEK